jgi:hypothetical protein
MKLAGLVFALTLSTASAATLVSNLGSPVVINPFMTECCWQAASFQTDALSHSLNSITVLAGNPISSPSVFANLRADASGLPGAVVISLNVPAIPAALDQLALTPQAAFTLAANTKYWLELGVNDDKDNSTNARFVWAAVDNSVVTGPGSIPTEYAFTNVGLPWFSGSVPNVAQSIQVDVDRSVPEPATMLLTAGSGFLLWMLRRRPA